MPPDLHTNINFSNNSIVNKKLLNNIDENNKNCSNINN